MDILRIVACGVGIALILKLIMEEDKRHALLIRLMACVLLIGLALPYLNTILQIIKDLSARIGIADTYLTIIFKIIGIAYITEFGYQLCKDTGEESIGTHIQFIGKMLILVLAAPIALALIDLITQLI